MRFITHATACLILAASGCAWLWKTDSALHRTARPAPAEPVPLTPQPDEPVPPPLSEPSPRIPDPSTGELQTRRDADLPPSPTNPPARPASNTVLQPVSTIRWDVRHLSTERRPIQTLMIGNGPSRTLVLGSLYGDEPAATRLVEQLADQLASRPREAAGTTTLFVRTPNPDGLSRGARLNSRNVDLNHNFPSRDLRLSSRERSGPWPGSEAETQTLLRLISEFQPDRVLHVRTGSSNRPLVIHNRRATPAAQRLQSRYPVEVRPLEPNAGAGSLESYVTGTLDREILTFIIPRADNSTAAWQTHRDALLTALTYSPARPGRPETSPVVPSTDPVAGMRHQGPSGPDRTSVGASLTGIVEIGNPPATGSQQQDGWVPVGKPRRGADSHALPTDLPSGYIELPSPD